MRKLALALAATAALGFTAPVFTATDASAAHGMKVAQADVRVKVGRGHRHGHAKKVVVRRDRGWHGGRHHHGGKKVVVIKRRVYR